MVAGRHLAALCSTPGERNRLGLAFRQEGFWRGDGYLCLGDDREPARVPRPRTSPWSSSGRPGSDVRLASDACFHAGLFSSDRMADVLVEGAGRAVEAGCLRLRVPVEMGWLLRPPGTASDLVLYESAVDRVVSREPAVVLCVYDLHCLDVRMLTTVLTTHQTVFLDGTVLVNPHYRSGAGSRGATEPDEAWPGPAGAQSRRTAPLPADDRWDSLTRSELRIVAYVVAGLTNREMAAALVVSRHTVDAHLKHIFVKLDIHNRVELTVLALQQPVD